MRFESSSGRGGGAAARARARGGADRARVRADYARVMCVRADVEGWRARVARCESRRCAGDMVACILMHAIASTAATATTTTTTA